MVDESTYDFNKPWGQGGLKISSIDDGNKKIEIYLVSLTRIHKKYLGEYVLSGNKIKLLNTHCKQLSDFRSLSVFMLIFIPIIAGIILTINSIIMNIWPAAPSVSMMSKTLKQE